jgi:hypothetical protein
MTASLLADWTVDIDPELLQAYRLPKNGYRILEKQESDDLQIPHQSAVAQFQFKLHMFIFILVFAELL